METRSLIRFVAICLATVTLVDASIPLAISAYESPYFYPSAQLLLGIISFGITHKYGSDWFKKITPDTGYHLKLLSESYDSESRITTLRYIRDGSKALLYKYGLNLLAFASAGLSLQTSGFLLLPAVTGGMVAALMPLFVKVVARAKVIEKYEYIPATTEFRDVMENLHGIGAVFTSDVEDDEKYRSLVESFANDPDHKDQAHARRWLDRNNGKGYYNDFNVSTLLQYYPQSKICEQLELAQLERIREQENQQLNEGTT